MLGIAFVLMMAAAAASMLLYKDEVGDLLLAALDGTPPLPAAPPPVTRVPATPVQAPAAPPPAAPAATSQAPVEQAPPPPDQAAGGPTNIADLMAAARAARGESVPTAASADAAAVPVPTGEAAPADQATPEPAAPPDPVAVDDALGRLGRSAEADTMRPPVTVQRDGARGGAPAATIEVAVPTLATRDGVSEAYRMLLRGDFNAALGVYERVLDDDPGNLQALLGRAAALHKLRRLEEARAAYEQVLGADPGNREALTNLLAIVATDDPQDAVARLRELARQAPGFSPVIGQLGLLYGRMGATDAALTELTRAVALDPGNLLYRYNLAVLLDRAGRRDEAIAAYRLVIEGLRTSPGALTVSPDGLRARLQFLMSTG